MGTRTFVNLFSGTIGGNPTFSGDVTVTGDLNVNGDLNFGDASVDTLTATGDINLLDDVKLELGTGKDYWWVYNSTGTQLELQSTDIDGGGSDGLILHVPDGTQQLIVDDTLIVNGTQASSSKLSVVGGDGILHSTTETNSSAKGARYGALHFTIAEEPFFIFSSLSTSSSNQANWGGGTSAGNAATSLRFYLASNNTTTTGSRVLTMETTQPTTQKSANNTNGQGFWQRLMDGGTDADSSGGNSGATMTVQAGDGSDAAGSSGANGGAGGGFAYRLGAGGAGDGGGSAGADGTYVIADNSGNERFKVDSDGVLTLTESGGDTFSITLTGTEAQINTSDSPIDFRSSTEFSSNTSILDNVSAFFGSSSTSDSLIKWSTDQTDDSLLMGLSRSLLVTDIANRGKDHDHSAQTNPTIFIHSATDPDTDNAQWVSITHDQTDSVIQSSTGHLRVVVENNNNLSITDLLTDATQKDSIVTGMHFTNSEEDSVMLFGQQQTAANIVNFGGGSAVNNAATKLRFWTGTDNTTLTGTQVGETLLRNWSLTPGTIGDGIAATGDGALTVTQTINDTTTSNGTAGTYAGVRLDITDTDTSAYDSVFGYVVGSNGQEVWTVGLGGATSINDPTGGLRLDTDGSGVPRVWAQTAANIEFGYDNSDTLEQSLILVNTASQVNELTVTGAIASNSPSLAATGDDTNIDLTLTAKGTGDTVLSTGNLTFTQTFERVVDIGINVVGQGATAPVQTDRDVYSVLAFDADGETVFAEVTVPADWDGSSDMTFGVTWTNESGTAIADTETVIWEIEYRSRATGELYDGGTSETASATYTQSGAGTDKEIIETEITIDHDNANQPLTAGDVLGIKFHRDFTTDTYASDAEVINFTLNYMANTVSRR